MRFRSEKEEPVDEEDLKSLIMRGSDPAYFNMTRGVIAFANSGHRPMRGSSTLK